MVFLTGLFPHFPCDCMGTGAGTAHGKVIYAV